MDANSFIACGVVGENRPEAERYATLRLVSYLSQNALFVAYSILWIALGTGEPIIWWSAGTPPIGQVALIALLFGAGLLLLAFPLRIWASWILPRSYGQSNQSLVSWIIDWAKASILGGIFRLAVIAIVYGLIWNLGWIWPLAAALALTVVGILTSFLLPVLILPLFFRRSPLPEGALRSGILELADRAGSGAIEVETIDFSRRTPAANAALVGIGSTRRIVLTDTLLSRFSNDEVLVIVAHELGHQLGRHIGKQLAASAVLSMLAFFALDWLGTGAAHIFSLPAYATPAGLPLLVLVLSFIWFLLGPISAWFSRKFEFEADRYAIKLTGRADSFIAAMNRLSETNLARYRVPDWEEILLHGHPSIHRRIRMAEVVD